MEFKIEASSQTKILLGRIVKSLEEIAENLKPAVAVASADTNAPAGHLEEAINRTLAAKAPEEKKLSAKEKKALAKKLEGYGKEARLKLRELAEMVGKPKAKEFLVSQFKVGTVGELMGKPDGAELLQELANACSRLLTEPGPQEDKAPEDEDFFA